MPSQETHQRDPSDSSSDPIESRIGRIESSLRNESWLPTDVKGLLSAELPGLRALARGGLAVRKKLAKQVLVLAVTCSLYGLSPLDSETLSQLRVLDLELSEVACLEADEMDFS